MRLGIDFGTTRIVVAAVDRGNYPIISFDTPSGDRFGWYPALIANMGNDRCYGWEAWQAQEDPGAVVIRSIKRYLQDAGPLTEVQAGDRTYPMIELLTGLCQALRKALQSGSSLVLAPGEPIEIHLGVPANANGNQRFLTVEAFRRAGFAVLGLLNEPSAASIEYGHAVRSKQIGRPKDVILVYDLGGGTFDASVVELDDNRHEVVASEGIPSLGGDDFDEVLAELALDTAGIAQQRRDAMTQSEWFRLLDECRLRKEAVHPNTRRIVLDLETVADDWSAVSIPVSEFYERCQPMVAETLHATEDLLNGREDSIESVYVAGGATELPLVTRMLRERYGRKVRRSAHAQSSTAIGLAIQSDSHAGFSLRERFTRTFGVWREAEAGHTVVFDPLFLKGTPLPSEGGPPLTVVRRYYPAHNIGHFRYLECSHLSPEGRPTGEITLWDEIFFPFDAGQQSVQDLREMPVVRQDCGGQEMEERYECDAGGGVTVTISNLTGGYRRVYPLGRWSVSAPPIVPGKKRTRRSAARKS
ncbi:MAG: Hsp70 family protein [Bryobacteraceae bacterium]